MGTGIALRGTRIRVSPENAGRAQAAMVAARRNREYGSFRPELSDDGSIVDLEFTGEKAGWGEEQEFIAFAKYCREGDFIEFADDQGGIYRYIKRNGEVIEETAEISYPSDKQGKE